MMKKINLKTKKIIILESSPDFSDNTKYLFDEIIKRKINDKYKIIWIVNDIKKFKKIKIKNVKFTKRGNNAIEKAIRIFITIKSKVIIDNNKFIHKRNNNQTRIHLTHGSFIKLPEKYCSKCGEIDYLIQQSDYFTNINSKLFNVSKDKIITTGFPRNDAMFDKDNQLELFKEIKRKKTVCWMPTYRNNKNDKDAETKDSFKYGVPCINDEDQLNKLNNLLKEKEILLLLKLHPAEDTTNIKSINLSNIKIIENSEYIYKYFQSFDALITDYSSVYYDFLLTEKPIGLAIPDINEYKKTTNLITDNFEKDIVGEQIYTFNDLISFFENIANNKDLMKEERLEKTRLYNKYLDGNASKRVVDILEKILKER